MAIILMSTIAAPMIREKDDIRPFAEAIDEKLNGQRLLAFDLDDYAPLLAVLFYLEGPFDYVPDATAAPKESAVYLVRGKDKAKFAKKFHIMEEMVPPLLEKDAIVVRAVRK